MQPCAPHSDRYSKSIASRQRPNTRQAQCFANPCMRVAASNSKAPLRPIRHHAADDGCCPQPNIAAHREASAQHKEFSCPQHSASLAVHARLTSGVCRSIRSEEHTSELQSLMRTSYAVFCLKKKKRQQAQTAPAAYLIQIDRQTTESIFISQTDAY